MGKLAGVDLGGGLGLAELLNGEGLADGVGVTDVRGQPGVGVVQLLLPEVLAVRVVKAVVDDPTPKVSIPAE